MAAPKRDITRVALYIRVSTEEQAVRGYSLAAQEEALITFAKENGYKIVGIYRDEGISGRKPVLKRPAMMELLSDVEAKKVDLIAFTKIDRWFRSVGDFHTVQKILDKHGVVWKTILEDYGTNSADARFKTNIMLSVAENEADRTSERIKFVFESRVQKGEAPFPPHIAPYGYTVKKIDGIRKLVKNPETQEATARFFQLAASRSIRYAGEVTNREFNMVRAYTQWYNMATNIAYTGTYHGVENYCEPYITKEEFDRINSNPRQARKTQKNRVYIFAGLVKCARCGRRMNGKYATSGTTREYFYYRCFGKLVGNCTNGTFSEIKLEEYLLENVRAEMERQITEYEIAQAAPKRQKKKADVTKLRERLRRVNVSYHAENMTDEEYTKETTEIKALIAEAEKAAAAEDETKKIDIDALKAFLASDFDTIYSSLSKEEKRTLWHSVIDYITLDGQTVKGVKFRE